MKKIFLFAVIIAFSSCFSLKRQDYSVVEGYQIGNTSSQNVTLAFYENGIPKMIYFERIDRSGLVLVPLDSCVKQRSVLLHDSVIAIDPGQTILFYAYELMWNDNIATSLRYCGAGNTAIFLFSNRLAFLGDSVTISSQDADPVVLPLNNNQLWETWYDQNTFTYYHYWRIE